MSDTISGTITLDVKLTESKTVRGVSFAASHNYKSVVNLSSNNEGEDSIYDSGLQTLDASTSIDFDVNGSLTDGFGDSVDGTHVTQIVIINSSTNGATLKVGGDANSVPFLDTAAAAAYIPAGGFIAMCGTASNPLATVTDTTDDIIQLTNTHSTNAATYRILIVMKGAESGS